MYPLCGCMKFPLIFSLIGVVIDGFRWLRLVNNVRKSTEDSGKVLTMVEESCNSPEFEEDDPTAGGVKNMPVACFLVRGRIH